MRKIKLKRTIGTTNRDQVQVKDILIEKISVTIVIEQVIQHIECFKLENYLKKQGKRIVLHDNDDIQDIAHSCTRSEIQRLNSFKLNSSTNN